MLPPSLPSDVSQKRLAKAFEKVGFTIDYHGGKGGHYKLVDPKSQKFITLQSKIWKVVLKDKLKQAEALGYDAAYKKADITNRRRLLISMVANLELNGKVLIVNWKKPFELVARRPKLNYGGDGGS